MTYLEQLHPWCIIRLLPNMQRLIVGRFRRRHDATEHMQVLQRLVPEATYTIIFDLQSKSADPSVESTLPVQQPFEK